LLVAYQPGNGSRQYSIPPGVTSIGSSAFSGSHLTSVTIPNSVTSIGEYAFYGNQLTSVTKGNSVTGIGASAFSSNQLTSVTIGNSVTSIGDYAFYGNQLTSVTIPDSVTSIGEGAFGGNPELRAISVAVDNPEYVSIDDVLFSKDRTLLIAYPAGKGSQYSIPPGVTSIGDYAFYGSQLTSVTIPNSVTSIGYMAFRNNQLTSVSIGANVRLETMPANDRYVDSSFPFDNGLGAFYDTGGKRAGVYTLTGETWSYTAW
jgi:hypothetical protein